MQTPSFLEHRHLFSLKLPVHTAKRQKLYHLVHSKYNMSFSTSHLLELEDVTSVLLILIHSNKLTL